MKPKIGPKALNNARKEADFWTLPELRGLLSIWLGHLGVARKNADLIRINKARFNVIIFTIAIELHIDRWHWNRWV